MKVLSLLLAAAPVAFAGRLLVATDTYIGSGGVRVSPAPAPQFALGTFGANQCPAGFRQITSAECTGGMNNQAANAFIAVPFDITAGSAMMGDAGGNPVASFDAVNNDHAFASADSCIVDQSIGGVTTVRPNVVGVAYGLATGSAGRSNKICKMCEPCLVNTWRRNCEGSETAEVCAPCTVPVCPQGQTVIACTLIADAVCSGVNTWIDWFWTLWVWQIILSWLGWW